MSEIQYCEDCKHIILPHARDNCTAHQVSLAKCARTPTHDPDQFIARVFNETSLAMYCSASRETGVATCPKFEAKDG